MFCLNLIFVSCWFACFLDWSQQNNYFFFFSFVYFILLFYFIDFRIFEFFIVLVFPDLLCTASSRDTVTDGVVHNRCTTAHLFYLPFRFHYDVTGKGLNKYLLLAKTGQMNI